MKPYDVYDNAHIYIAAIAKDGIKPHLVMTRVCALNLVELLVQENVDDRAWKEDLANIIASLEVRLDILKTGLKILGPVYEEKHDAILRWKTYIDVTGGRVQVKK